MIPRKGGGMKNKKWTILIVGLLVLCVASSNAETKKLKEIGRYTLCRFKGEVPTSEVMQTLIEMYAGDIKYGFDLAGYGDLYLPFIEQMKTADVKEEEIGIGDKFMWMLFRSGGKVKIVEDVEWAGKKPLPVFAFTVEKEYKQYEFVMPKPCGNISLVRVTEVIPDAVCDLKVTPAKANIGDAITVNMGGSQHAKSLQVEVYGPDGTKIASKDLTLEAAAWQITFDKPGEYTFQGKAFNPAGKASVNPCQAKTYINTPPVCKLFTSCLPCEDYVGRPITVDGSQSSDPDGQVVKADFEIRDEMGTVVDTYSDSEQPFTWEKVFRQPGYYSVTLVVTDDFGATSDPCQLDINVTQKKCFFGIEGGPLYARGSYGPYMATLLGLSCWIVPDVLDFSVAGGGALALKGEPWKSFFLAKVLLNVHSGAAFFGGGLGLSSKVREDRDQSDVFLVANVGLKVFDNWTSRGAVFLEGQGPIGKGRSFADHNKFMFGFKFLF